MLIKIFFTGKTKESYLQTGIADYEKRLKKYFPLSITEIIAKKSPNPELVKQSESEILLKQIMPQDFVIILDERGKQLKSVELANQVQKFLNTVNKNIVFVIGGAYGFDKKVYDRANFLFSLSMFTFSHQMVRVIFLEQLYRAMTILKNEPYHH